MIIQCCYCHECVPVVLQLANFNLVSPSRLILVSACKNCWNCSSIYSTRGCQHLKGHHHFWLSPDKVKSMKNYQWRKSPFWKSLQSYHYFELSISSPKPGKSRTLRLSLTWKGLSRQRWKFEQQRSPPHPPPSSRAGSGPHLQRSSAENKNLEEEHRKDGEITFFWQTSARNMELMREALPRPDSPASIKLNENPRFTARLYTCTAQCTRSN